MRPAVGAPGEWYVLDILLLQDTEIRAIVFHLALEHGRSAVRSSADGIGRCDAQVQSGDCVTQCLGQDIGGAEIRAWDEPCDLRLCGRVTLLKPRKQLLDYTVMSACALRACTTGGMCARVVEQCLTATTARRKSVLFEMLV